MFNRKELKQRAKGVLSGNYWNIFVLTLLVNIVPSILVSLITRMLNYAASSLLSVIAVPLVSLPLEIGIYKYIFEVRKSNAANNGSLFYAFRSNYVNIAGTLFVKTFILLLWAILPIAILGIGYVMTPQMATDEDLLILLMIALIGSCITMVPLLIKSYSFYLVEFILTDNPDKSWCEALSESKTLMHGNKFRVFVLNLSFIGWYALGLLAFGIGVLFVTPYVTATNVELYHELAGKNYNTEEA